MDTIDDFMDGQRPSSREIRSSPLGTWKTDTVGE